MGYDDGFVKDLRKTFLEEASEIIEAIEEEIIILEQDPDRKKSIPILFRYVHTLKGSSAAVGFISVSKFIHRVESLMILLREGEIKDMSKAIEFLFFFIDKIKEWFLILENNIESNIDTSIDLLKINQFIETSRNNIESKVHSEIETAKQGEKAFEIWEDEPKHNDDGKHQDPDFGLIAENKDEKEFSSSRTTKSLAKDKYIKVELGRLDMMLNYIGELVIYQSVLEEQISSANSGLALKTSVKSSKIVKDIQRISMSLRMIPLKKTFQKMNRIVRDSAKSLNKEVKFEVKGEEIELDKSIIDGIDGPIVHLIRNAIDHGLESGEERLKAGKEKVGQISISAIQKSGKVIVQIRDDGRGLDHKKILKKAIEKNIVNENDRILEKDIIQLIMRSGFSTKETVSDLSGRGVGMDVVNSDITKLNGNVQIKSSIGKGTTVNIILPTSMAVMECLIVKQHEYQFVIPTDNLYESVSLRKSKIHHFSENGELLKLRDETIPLYRLDKLLSSCQSDENIDHEVALVFHDDRDQAFSLLVEKILGHQQILRKNLGSELARIKGISGAAVLGDGQPSLILDPVNLVSRHEILKYGEKS